MCVCVCVLRLKTVACPPSSCWPTFLWLCQCGLTATYSHLTKMPCSYSGWDDDGNFASHHFIMDVAVRRPTLICHTHTHTHNQRALPSLAEMQKDVARRFGKIYFTGPKCAECTGIKLPAPVVTVELAREIRFSGYQPERNFVPARQHQSFVMPTMHVDMAAHEVNPTWTTDRVDLEAKSKSYGCVTLMLV